MDSVPATIQRTPQVIEKDAGLLDLRVMVRALRRSLWPALIAFVVVLLAVAIVYKLLPRAYSATATIALDRRVANMVAPGADPQLSTDSASVDTAVRALTSPTLAQQVVSRLNLASHPGFGIPPGADPRTTQPSEERAVSQILGGLTVKRQGTSYAIDIHYTAADPRTQRPLRTPSSTNMSTATATVRSPKMRGRRICWRRGWASCAAR